MFYGLNKFIKNLLPKRLFYRALLIVAIPVILIQLTITIVFFDSLWIKTNKGMTRALVGEIQTFIEVYSDDNFEKNNVTNIFSLYQDLNIEFIEDEKFNFTYDERWFSPIDRTLRRELKSKFGSGLFWFNTVNYKELVDVRIKYENGYFRFIVPKDRLTSTSARLFGLWITVPAFIVVFISLIFLKNQTRPITALAKAAERFGRGENVDEFKPSGAAEIRQAGYEFDRMRKRIMRHLNQRSEMLSGISHDLRTPLTRMKLQTAFIKNEDLANKLTEDINEMEKMLNEYLQFTSSSFIEKDELFDLSELMIEIINKYNNKNITKNIQSRVYLNGRKNLIKRCLNNLIENSIKYANKLNVELSKKKTNLVIKVEDDGPGTNLTEEQLVRPFVKGSEQLNQGTGLGLSIVQKLIKLNNGELKFDKSAYGGLKVTITFEIQ